MANNDSTPVAREIFLPIRKDGTQQKIPKKYKGVHTVQNSMGTYIFLHEKVDDKLIKQYDKEQNKKNAEDEETFEDDGEEKTDEEDSVEKPPSLSELKKMSRSDLDGLAEELGLDPDEYSNKGEIIKAIRKA